MKQIVGIFEERSALESALGLLNGAGYTAPQLTLISPPEDRFSPPPRLTHRGEWMLRTAVRWGIIGALVIEVPSLVVLLLLPVDVNVKVFMGATVWKLGAAFGAWIGAATAEERGLEQDLAAEYEAHLEAGHWLLGAAVTRRDRPTARGALLESDAIDVRDVTGTFEVKPPPRAEGARARG